MPILSIIVPVYHCEEYIDECIQSILLQSFQDWEVICVYDGEYVEGSNCQKYSIDPRIKLIEKEHGGLSDTRNVGFNYATGKYIYYLDSDDLLNGNCLADMIDQMESYNLDVLNFDALTFTKDHLNEPPNRYARKLPNTVLEGKFLLNIMLATGQWRSPVWLICIRRSFYLENNLTFLKGIIHEDELFTYVCLSNAKRTKWVSDQYNLHRVHNNSIMSSGITHLNFDGYVRVYLGVFNFNSQNNFNLPVAKKFEYRVLKLAIARYNSLNVSEKLKITPLEKSEYDIFKTGLDEFALVKENGIVLNSLYPKNASLISYSQSLRMPLISIVMPVFNAGKYLREMLTDLCSQSLNNWELICVNDGSTDDSVDILKEFAEKDNRIQIINQSNEFAGKARNKGMDCARGEYLLFLDADDRVDVRLLELSVGSAFNYGSDLVLFGADVFDSNTKKIFESKWLLRSDLIPTNPFSPTDVKDNLFQLVTGVPWNKLFKRSFVISSGLRFQEIQRSNDVFFVLSSLALAKKISVLDMPLVHYRKNSGTSLQDTVTTTPLSFYYAFLLTKQELIKIGLYETYRVSFINTCIRNIVNNFKKLKTTESIIHLYIHIKDTILDQLDILTLNETEIVRPEDYALLKYIRDHTIIEYLQNRCHLILQKTVTKNNNTENLENFQNMYLPSLPREIVNQGATQKDDFALGYYKKFENHTEYADFLYSLKDYGPCFEQCLLSLDSKDSVFRIAQLYRNGFGVPKDISRACLYMQMAIDMGHKGAVNEYQKIAPRQNGTLSQKKELLDVLLDIQSNEGLSEMISVYISVLPDNGLQSYYNLGKICGGGTEKDIILSEWLFKKAMELDTPGAKEALDEIMKEKAESEGV